MGSRGVDPEKWAELEVDQPGSRSRMIDALTSGSVIRALKITEPVALIAVLAWLLAGFLRRHHG